MYSLLNRVLNLLLKISHIFMDGIYHPKFTLILCFLGTETSLIKPHLLSFYLTIYLLPSFSNQLLSSSWFPVVRHVDSFLLMFSILFMNACRFLPSKSTWRLTSSVKSPLNSPQEDPVVSIISDSLVYLMQGEEKIWAVKFYVY